MKVFGISKARVAAIALFDFGFVTSITKCLYGVKISQVGHLNYFLGQFLISDWTVQAYDKTNILVSNKASGEDYRVKKQQRIWMNDSLHIADDGPNRNAQEHGAFLVGGGVLAVQEQDRLQLFQS